MSFFALTRFEVKKLFKQKAALAGFIIPILACILFFLLNYVNRPAGTYNGVGIIMDMIYLQVNVLYVIPMIAILLAVHSVSREFSTGTLQSLMTKPVKRENIVVSKFLSLFLYMLCVIFSILVISFLFGLRWGYSEGFSSSIPKLLGIYVVYALGTMVLVAFTLVVASLGTTPVVAALVSLGFHRLWMILETFSRVREFTFSYHATMLIQLLMGSSVDPRQLYQSLVVIVIYIVAFLLIASSILERRDVFMPR